MTKAKPSYIAPARSPGSVVQQAPKPHLKSKRRNPLPAKTPARPFKSILQQHGITDAALADLRHAYTAAWSQAATVRRSGKRSVENVGTRSADDIRAEWQAARAAVLLKHGLPADLPIYERFPG